MSVQVPEPVLWALRYPTTQAGAGQASVSAGKLSEGRDCKDEMR